MISYRKSPSQRRQAKHSLPTYYSTTQSNFFKVYAQRVEFLNRLNQLMICVEKRKIEKIVDEIKSSNNQFKKYLNEKRIVTVKIQDVIQFEQMCQKLNGSSPLQILKISQKLDQLRHPPNSINPKNSTTDKENNRRQTYLMNRSLTSQIGQKCVNISVQNRQMIKKGFMSLLQRLQVLKKDEFKNQTKYLQSVINRQYQKLKSTGQDNNHLHKSLNYTKKINIIEELEKEEMKNGLYPIIMSNIRQETLAIEHVLSTFSGLNHQE